MSCYFDGDTVPPSSQVFSALHLNFMHKTTQNKGCRTQRKREDWGKATLATVKALTEFCLDQTDVRKLYCSANLNTEQIHVGNIGFINLNIERTTVSSPKVYWTATNPPDYHFKEWKFVSKDKSRGNKMLFNLFSFFLSRMSNLPLSYNPNMVSFRK